jgi:hypothetical protein
MKRLGRVIGCLAVAFIAAVGIYWWLYGTDQGLFPELRPELKVPPGYTLTFRDGPKFYTWVMTEDEKVGERHRSGIGMYFGHHPNLSAAKGAPERIAGRVCSKSVTWLVEQNDAANDPWVRRDAVLDYKHGSGFQTIKLHVWVWGQSEAQVAGLAKQLETLSIVFRQTE